MNLYKDLDSVDYRSFLAKLRSRGFGEGYLSLLHLFYLIQHALTNDSTYFRIK